jgi:thiol-disulfide isomerase/thioredoxin
MKKLLTVVIAVFVLVPFLLSCSSSENKETDNSATTTTQTQALAAGGTGLQVPDISGQMHSLNEFAGKPTIINFWGTWCPPCRKEMPDLQIIYNEYGPLGLQIIGLSVNDTPEKVRRYIEKYGYNWTMLMSTRESMKHFRLGSGVPLTIFLDKEGKEVGRYVGMRTYKDFKAQVEKII